MRVRYASNSVRTATCLAQGSAVERADVDAFLAEARFDARPCRFEDGSGARAAGGPVEVPAIGHVVVGLRDLLRPQPEERSDQLLEEHHGHFFVVALGFADVRGARPEPEIHFPPAL